MKLYLKIFVFLFCFNSYAQVQKNFDDGLLKFMNKDYENAIVAFNEVLMLSPQNFDAHYYIGVSNLKLKFYKTALVNFDKTIVINPGYSRAYYNRGVAKFYLNQKENGCLDFKKAVELEPGYDEAIKSIKEFCN